VVSKTKQQALDDFTARLLSSPAKNHIARIILFGSVQDETDRPESDIDVLVFGTDRLPELSAACAVASFETALQWGESVEPLVYCIDDLRFPQSYFLYDSIRRGKEIYRAEEGETNDAHDT
jgi:predicted nucleotidyltransferase